MNSISKMLNTLLVMLSLAGSLMADGYCAFYSDSACTMNANSVSYEIGNLGCISPQGQYIKCDENADPSVTITHYDEPGCPTDEGFSYSIGSNKCIELAQDGLYSANGSYQIDNIVIPDVRETKRTERAERREKTTKARSTCTASIQTWDNKHCTGPAGTYPDFQVVTNSKVSVNSGCYVSEFTQAFATTGAANCDILFFASSDCSGSELLSSSLHDTCQESDLQGEGTPGSFMWQCPLNACS